MSFLMLPARRNVPDHLHKKLTRRPLVGMPGDRFGDLRNSVICDSTVRTCHN